MTREQQGIVLFLCFLLVLFFFLTAPPAPLPQSFPATVGGDSSKNKSAGGEILVEVDGNVNRRGVYTVEMGISVLDVIEKAGGIKGNLSLPPEIVLARIEKNCRINVLAEEKGKGKVSLEPLAPKKLPVLFIPIKINTANIEELITLPGIGPKTARAIIEYRERGEKFSSPEDLLQVRGIGPKKLAAIRSHITVQ